MKEQDLFHRVYSARDGSLRVLLAVEKEGAYANLALQKLHSKHRMKPSDTALLTELVYGTLRWRNNLDWVINQFSKLPVDRMNYIVRNILRMGVYQLLFLERIPPSAACNESVKLAKAWGLERLAGFVNGILRSVVRNRDQIVYPPLRENPGLHISIKYSHPHWLVERWLKRFGEEETRSLCKADNERPPFVLRCNTLRTTPEKLCRELKKNNIEAAPSPYIPEGVRVSHITSLPELPFFRDGYFVVQDESSMLASLVLNPRAGSFVIDSCSGPGGKTTHLAQIMNNRGKILALDVHEHRLQLIAETAERLGITIIERQLLDARLIPQELRGKADYVLVDAPCSGLGVIRRRPDLRWRVAPDDLSLYSQQQLEILKGAAITLKTGGVLVYSTCSTEPEENQDVIARFLRETEGFQLEDITGLIPFPLVYEEDCRTARSGYLQLLPHRHGTDGFFIARLRKTEKGR
ncbi:MAG TPA: 16S rRNA (cytosine(967)-C(5))-methyltransferase RsmB [Syntrophomonadaceae bacterium]|nr:16S rRNA (cytosine(967)-C(5))-methyltransferase RsmB [Syntrophomonadaceae bacterium]